MNFKLLLPVLLALAVPLVVRRANIPQHLLGHVALHQEALIDAESGRKLNEILRQMGSDEIGYPTNIAADLKTGVKKVQHRHVGEAKPMEADGTCSHHLLVRDGNSSDCILPQRIDVGKHFIMTGGPEAAVMTSRAPSVGATFVAGMKWGWNMGHWKNLSLKLEDSFGRRVPVYGERMLQRKDASLSNADAETIREPYEDMISRVSSFGRYLFDLKQLPVVEKLFENPKFLQFAKSLCPKEKQILDPFQFNFILSVPGQTVALHLDSPYFLGATRFQVPQWLLAVMVFSGLFQDRFIDQVQVVGYLHDQMAMTDRDSGGLFLYYDENSATPKSFPSSPLSGISVDGSKTLHAAGVFKPDVKTPSLDKDKDNALFYAGDERWELRSEGQAVQQYNSSELRMTIVYRARCFASELVGHPGPGKCWEIVVSSDVELLINPFDLPLLQSALLRRDRDISSKRQKICSALQHFSSILNFEVRNLGQHQGLDQILKTLKDDLVMKRRITREQASTIDRLDLAVMLLDTYIKYPLPDLQHALVPLNYCALPRRAGKFREVLGRLLSPFCG